MNNEMVKFKYEPKPVLVGERLWRKQQQWKFEFLHVSSEGSCVVIVMIYASAV